MDVNPEFEIINTFNLDSSSVEILYTPVNYLTGNFDLDDAINKSWEKLCQDAEKNSRKCFDSPGYSVDSVNYKNDRLILKISNTTYKQYITTFKDKELLLKFPKSTFPKLLSIFGYILTSDNYLIFGDNSNLTRSAGQFSAPGGTVQRTSLLSSQYVFNEFKRELFEETGIDDSNLVSTKLICIAVKSDTNNTPRLVFVSKANVSKSEIEKLFSKSDKEFSGLVFIHNSVEEINHLSSNLNSNWTIKVLNEYYTNNNNIIDCLQGKEPTSI